MDITQFDVSCCQRCRHFTLEGRRGGHCGQLNVPVQGRWTACSLANPVFSEPISTVTQPHVAQPSVATAWPEGLKLARRDLSVVESPDFVESA
ncbi:hypothetical protein PN498_07955 [Oscillatoria sp. CS-180]|uniref:hypothetical protein n=1 Tax=Oscillatoria sp. CS-180 TaxID=3021720 RepID=UPI00232FCD7A|nr:hypothetical protein [Oscillatoria sp. CS-180]MDB9525915.1 hypothetical protein [Oscillatoria sp. CS-180]